MAFLWPFFAAYGNKKSRGEWGFWINLYSLPSWECSVHHPPGLMVKSCKSFNAWNEIFLAEIQGANTQNQLKCFSSAEHNQLFLSLEKQFYCFISFIFLGLGIDFCSTNPPKKEENQLHERCPVGDRRRTKEPAEIWGQIIKEEKFSWRHRLFFKAS